MSAVKRQLEAKQNGRKPVRKALSDVAHYPAMGGGNSIADWASCDGEAIHFLVNLVTGTGGAVLFGYSRDRGAYRVMVMDDGPGLKKWIPATTDITEAIWNFHAELTDAVARMEADDQNSP